MQKFFLINKEFVTENDAKISIKQRACLFGDGIFETCRVENSKIYNFKAHKNRIKAGLQALKFKDKINKIDELEYICYQLIKKNELENGILRIAISRGIGSVGYLPTYDSETLIVVETMPQRKVSDGKIILGIGKNKKPPKNSLPINCKTMQGLCYTLNKIEAQEKGFFDCIMLSQKNFISETSSANIFWVKNDQIYTPAETCDILLGTIREKLLKNKNLKIKKLSAKISTLKNADEIFLTNTSFLVLPVDELRVGKNVIKFKKDIGEKVLQFLQDDVKKLC
ncbi:MAG: hypothetical protein FJ368_02130 [Pelagibacterales bacterium]|nr:hypothetical protein [Pelagibacterales bacterium]